MDVICSVLNSTLRKPGGVQTSLYTCIDQLASLNSRIHQNYSISASTPGKKEEGNGIEQ